MLKPTWKGRISFGLVNIPVTLYPIERRRDLSFHLLDVRDASRVRYRRVSEATGKEVPWDKIVKGYAYDPGNYVVLDDAELKRAAPEMTRRIEIEQFVELKAIDVTYLEKPYVLVPDQGGEKGYVLLREAMAAAGRVGIAQVVIRSRGGLAALMPHGEALLLELLRFHEELQPLDEYDLPRRDDPRLKPAKKELELATQLIDGMAGPWRADAYRDDYRAAVLKLIERRLKSKGTATPPEVDDADDARAPPTVNFMEVLRRSLKAKNGRRSPRAKRPRKAGRRAG